MLGIAGKGEAVGGGTQSLLFILCYAHNVSKFKLSSSVQKLTTAICCVHEN